MHKCASALLLQQSRRSLLAGADARRYADAVVAGAGQGQPGGAAMFGGGDRRAVVRPVLGERVRPSADPNCSRLGVDVEMAAQLVEHFGQ